MHELNLLNLALVSGIVKRNVGHIAVDYKHQAAHSKRNKWKGG